MALTWRPDPTTLAAFLDYVAGLDTSEREKVRRVVASEVEWHRWVHSRMVAVLDLEPDRPSEGPDPRPVLAFAEDDLAKWEFAASQL